MLFRASAAICGAIITFAVFADAARGQDATVHSSAVVDEARGVALVVPLDCRAGPVPW